MLKYKPQSKCSRKDSFIGIGIICFMYSNDEYRVARKNCLINASQPPYVQKKDEIYSFSKGFSCAVFRPFALFSPEPFRFTGMLIPAGCVSQAVSMLDSPGIQPLGDTSGETGEPEFERSHSISPSCLCLQQPLNVAVCLPYSNVSHMKHSAMIPYSSWNPQTPGRPQLTQLLSLPTRSGLSFLFV